MKLHTFLWVRGSYWATFTYARTIFIPVRNSSTAKSNAQTFCICTCSKTIIVLGHIRATICDWDILPTKETVQSAEKFTSNKFIPAPIHTSQYAFYGESVLTVSYITHLCNTTLIKINIVFRISAGQTVLILTINVYLDGQCKIYVTRFIINSSKILN